MATEIALPKGFGAVSSVFGGGAPVNDDLGNGVQSSYGIMGFKGKVWSTRYQGQETPLMREDGDGPRGSIEVVLLKASPAISKIFYKNGYVEGSNAAPDCWSADGVKPDGSVQAKCNATCADCPMNAWGSRVTDAGKQGKACSDSRRMAITPIADIDNELFGGPMLLRIPAASLKDLKAYGDLLTSYGYPYYGVATRISFDPKDAYPKFIFSAIRPLDDQEAAKVVMLRDDKRVSTVLSEAQAAAATGGAEPAKQVASSPFEQPGPASAASTAQSVQEPKKTPVESQAATTAPAIDPAAEAKKAAIAERKRKAAEAAAEAARLAALAAAEDDEDDVDPETGEVTPAGNAPTSFDDMLEKIL